MTERESSGDNLHMIGAVVPCYDELDGDVEVMARFAVKEHNDKQHSNLEFVRVIHASMGYVGGILYHLIIEVVDDSCSVRKVYKTSVDDIPWLSSRYLCEFIHLDDLQVAVLSPTDSLPNYLDYDVQSETHSYEALVAVNLHNKHHNANLMLIKPVHAEKGTITGIRYFLTIEVLNLDSGNRELYEFQLWRAPWDKLKFLDKSNHIYDLAGIRSRPSVVECGRWVESMARFAVLEISNIQGSNLKFIRVIHASEGFVDGTNLCYLIIEVVDSFSVRKVYKTQAGFDIARNRPHLFKFIHLDDLERAVDPHLGLQSNTYYFEARLAVKLHNENNNTNLDFRRVVHAEVGLITGITYFLTIEVIDCTYNLKLYEFPLWRRATWDRLELLNKPNHLHDPADLRTLKVRNGIVIGSKYFFKSVSDEGLRGERKGEHRGGSKGGDHRRRNQRGRIESPCRRLHHHCCQQ